MKKEPQQKPSAPKGVTALEELPCSVVYYPVGYGTFFGFSEEPGGPILLCSCAQEAIDYYVELRLLDRDRSVWGWGRDAVGRFILGASDFPIDLVEALMADGVPDDARVTARLRFGDRLCHECNQVVTQFRYCHEMYGSVFKQNYGWYINKQAYEFGIHPIRKFRHMLRERCPQELLDLMELDPVETEERRRGLMQESQLEWDAYRQARDAGEKLPERSTPLWHLADDLDKRLQKQNRRMWRVIENAVRQKFGHKRVGEGWTSETILYYIVRSLFPGLTILRHARPEWLAGLELDIFIPEQRVAIEYQGIQHFEPVAHWGGDAALERQRERDERKKDICAALGIPLIYFRHDEELSTETVMRKLREHIGA